MTTSASTPPPAWYPDPAGSPRLRWWDGKRWTTKLADREEVAAEQAARQAEEAQAAEAAHQAEEAQAAYRAEQEQAVFHESQQAGGAVDLGKGGPVAYVPAQDLPRGGGMHHRTEELPEMGSPAEPVAVDEPDGDEDHIKRRNIVIGAAAAGLALLLLLAWFLLGGDEESEKSPAPAGTAATASATPSDTPSATPSDAPSETPSATPSETPSATTPAPAPVPTAAPAPTAPNVVTLCTAAREAQSLRPTAAELTPEVIASYAPYVAALEELTAELPEPVKADGQVVTDFNQLYADLDPDNPQPPPVTEELQTAGQRLAQYLEETC